MKEVYLILALLLLTSCKHEDWNFTQNSDEHSHNIIFQNSSSQLDILMNRELTDMTMPIISKKAAESYLGHNDLQSVMYYNIYNSLALLQVENYAEAYEYIFKTQQHYHKLHKGQTAGLFWYGKYLISQYVQNYQDAVNQVLEAAEHFRQPEGISFDYSNFLLEAIRNYVIIGDYEKAIAMMTIFEPSIYEAPSRIKFKYYDTWLNIYKHTDPSKINEILGIILSEIPPYDIYWLNIAYSFYLTGEYNHASEALDNYSLYNSQFGTSTAYWGVSAHIMEGFGKDSEALNYFKKYLTEIESEYHKLIDSGIILKEQQMNVELERMRNRHISTTLGLCIALLSLLSLAVYLILRHRLLSEHKEVIKYSLMVSKAEDEIKRLQILYENKTLDNRLREALSYRMSIFNKMVLGKMIPNYYSETAEDELRKFISSKDTFLESTCRTFEALHPEFTAFLTSCKLTERERGCCCLYCMGMKGNEIAAYMGLADRSYYNFSSNIRKKIGLTEYKTNLDFFLRSKLNELENFS